MRTFLLTCLLIFFQDAALAQLNQFANISSKQFIFQAEIDNEPFAFVSNDYYIQLNIYTGDFIIEVPVSSLYYSKINPLYKEHNEFDHECFQIQGNIPINRVLEEGKVVYEEPIVTALTFDGNKFETSISFKVLNRFPDGFIILAESKFPQSYFSISDPEDAPNDAIIHFNFHAN